MNHLQVGQHDRRGAEARGDQADGAAARAELEHLVRGRGYTTIMGRGYTTMRGASAELEHPAARQVQSNVQWGPRHPLWPLPLHALRQRHARIEMLREEHRDTRAHVSAGAHVRSCVCECV